jgi:hypothetical protein
MQKNFKILFIFTAIFLILGLIIEGINLYYNAIYFDEVALNGAFQLFNGLRKINAGAKLGLNLYLFHGIGPYLVHYPLFVLFGKNLLSSEIARYFVSPFIFVLSHIVFLRSLRFNWKFIFFSLFIFIFIFFNLFSLSNLFYPGGSLLSVRSGVILMLIPIISKFINSDKLSLSKIAFISLIIGLGWSLFNDQGLYLFLSILIILIIYKRISFIFLYLVFSIFTMLSTLFIFSGFNFYGLCNILKYNLLSIPQNQIWYFGSPPQFYLANVFFIFINWQIVFRYCLFIFNLIVFLFFKEKNQFFKKNKNLFYLIFIYSLFSSLTILSITSENYLSVMTRLQIFLIFIYLREFFVNKHMIFKDKKYKKENKISLILIGTVTICALFFLSFVFNSYASIKKYKLTFVLFNPKKEQGVYLSRIWEKTLDKIDKILRGGRAKFFLTYSGLINSKYGDQSGRFDYIIHALSKKDRENYLADFRKKSPEYIFTISPQYSPFYEWLWKENWYFYKIIFTEYFPYESTPIYTIWKKSSKAKKGINVSSYLIDGKNLLLKNLPSSCLDFCLIEVKMDYDYRSILRNIFRPMVYTSNYGFFSSQFSLNPYENSFSFPIILNKDNYSKNNIIKIEIRIEPKLIFFQCPFCSFNLKKVEAKIIPLSDKDAQIIFKGISF